MTDYLWVDMNPWAQLPFLSNHYKISLFVNRGPTWQGIHVKNMVA